MAAWFLKMSRGVRGSSDAKEIQGDYDKWGNIYEYATSM